MASKSYTDFIMNLHDMDRSIVEPKREAKRCKKYIMFILYICFIANHAVAILGGV